jgi:hypothetical protein
VKNIKKQDSRHHMGEHDNYNYLIIIQQLLNIQSTIIIKIKIH